MVPDESVCFLLSVPAQYVTETMHRVSFATAQVNALFWSPRGLPRCRLFYQPVARFGG